MKTSLNHLPQHHQDALRRIVKHVREGNQVAFILLFGSYARGDFVEYDETIVDGHVESYTSDYDILVVVEKEAATTSKKWELVEKHIREDVHVGKTPVSLIIESLDHVNEQLSVGRYLYRDIVNEGVMLYSSNKYALEKPRILTPEEQKALEKEDFLRWFPKAKVAFSVVRMMCREGSKSAYLVHGKAQPLINHHYNEAAFNLHQTAERAYTAASLVFTSYKPRTHNLEELANRMETIEPRLAVFNRTEGEGKRLFDLLKRAYIEARYSKNYHITLEELNEIGELVQKLLKMVKKVCEERLER